MKWHLTKNLELCHFQVISISGLGQCCLQFKYAYVFPFLLFYFLISFLHISYPACRHITRFFLFPYPFSELFYNVLRWCFFYRNLILHHFSIEFLGIRLEDLIVPVEFATFIKSYFPLCFYLYFLL